MWGSGADPAVDVADFLSSNVVYVRQDAGTAAPHDREAAKRIEPKADER